MVAACIPPRHIGLSSRDCYACWMSARRLSTKTESKSCYCQFPIYRRAGNLSNKCFVVGCTRPERICIPLFLKTKLLQLYKLNLPKNARVCSEQQSQGSNARAIIMVRGLLLCKLKIISIWP